jgi:hypothetical protein
MKGRHMKSVSAKIVCLLSVAAMVGLGVANRSAPAAGGAATTRPGSAASKPAAESILKVLPAGTLAYAIVPNAQSAAGDVDKFLKAIGADELIKDEIPHGILKALLAHLPLGEGVNPNGGVGIALLDPTAFGIDLAQLVRSASATMPAADGNAAAKRWPVVFFLPGAGVKEVLGKLNPQPAEPYMKLDIEGVEFFAAPLGSYVLVSPNPKALAAVAGASQKAEGELRGRHLQIVSDSTLSVHLNMRAVYPLIQKGLTAADMLIAANTMGLAALPPPLLAYKEMKPMLGSHLDAMSHMEEMSVGIRLAPTGVVMDGAVAYAPSSTMGKALAAFAAPRSPAMDLLAPDGYVVAFSTAIKKGPAAAEAAAKNLELMPALAKLPKDQRGKVEKLARDFMSEVTGIGFVMGAPPEGARGAMSMSLVLQGEDSEKIKGLLEQGAALAQEIVQDLAKGQAGEKKDGAEEDGENKASDIQAVKITYEKGQEKMGDVAVDSIVVNLPSSNGFSFVPAMLGQIFGESQIAPLVAAADKNAVVITFGGERENLARAIKAAAGKQDKDKRILALKETAEAMKFMPKNIDAAAFFNMGNYFDLMVAMMKKMGANEALPFAIACKTPVAFASGADGAGQNFSLYVPTDMVKDVIGVITGIRSMRGGIRPGPAPVQPGGVDF